MTAIQRYTDEMIDAWVAAGHWTPERTVDFWRENARTRPDAAALADDRVAYTWSEAMRAIDGIAGGLITAGIPRDAVLLAQGPNSALFVLFKLACEEAGVIPAFLHAGFRRAEIDAVAQKVHPVGAVVGADDRFDAVGLYRDLSGRLPAMSHLFCIERNSHELPSIAGLALGPGHPDIEKRRIRPYEMTSIVTSSGTTGLPKCIEYSCWPRLASGRVYIERIGITKRDVVLSCIPFSTGGGDMQFHTTAQVGARYIVMPQFSPEAACALIEREQVTGAVMVPTMIARVLQLPDFGGHDLSSLRWVVSGGGMLPYEIGARFEQVTGAKIIQGYGLMDYGAVASHGVDDPSEMRLRSNGRLMPGTELRILDEQRRPLPTGMTGEICGRGPHCNGGYLGDPAATASAWRDGFFQTGDLGHLTSDGFLVLEGRSKDIIIRGGQNISAPEVEMILCRHPAVADAAIVAVPDQEMGERACAFVVLRPSASLDLTTVAEFMKSQELAAWKIPERLEIVTDFPMTAAGNKVDKRALVARLRVSPNQPPES